jgi:uncharacterized protein YqhQ
MQAFTTASPTDCELEVAVVGLRTWYENEKKDKKKSIIFKVLHKLFPCFFK